MKYKWMVIPVLIFVAAIYLFHSKKNKDIPSSLIGKWTTAAPGYQDRFIELTKKTIVYGLGGGKEQVYMISSLEEQPKGKNVIYTIDFKNSEVKFTRSFYYHPDNGGTIQFKHQEHIAWRKKSESSDQ